MENHNSDLTTSANASQAKDSPNVESGLDVDSDGNDSNSHTESLRIDVNAFQDDPSTVGSEFCENPATGSSISSKGLYLQTLKTTLLIIFKFYSLESPDMGGKESILQSGLWYTLKI